MNQTVFVKHQNFNLKQRLLMGAFALLILYFVFTLACVDAETRRIVVWHLAHPDPRFLFGTIE